MNHPLDELVEGLRSQGPDRDLSQLEPAVWRRIGGARIERASTFGFAPVRMASVVMALVVGAAVGGASAIAAASAPQETSVFALNSRLAPSTLLEARR
ncbi:hypothetical protein [Phenylobacterium sp.]|uniref:hypothetical protein n=1 Tax=Phenylobacterium sp. TaxID=1871053 RepID=UPI00289AA1F9|nr:hypothetical protein [Phenylobacterium sp.]